MRLAVLAGALALELLALGITLGVLVGLYRKDGTR